MAESPPLPNGRGSARATLRGHRFGGGKEQQAARHLWDPGPRAYGHARRSSIILPAPVAAAPPARLEEFLPAVYLKDTLT